MKTAHLRMHTALCSTSWYSCHSLKSYVFETHLSCHRQCKRHLQWTRHLSENASPLVCILLKIPQNIFNYQKYSHKSFYLLIYSWFKQILLEIWQKLIFKHYVGPWNYVSALCAEQSVHGSLPCAEQSLNCSHNCAEQSLQICSAHGREPCRHCSAHGREPCRLCSAHGVKT